MKTYVLFFIIIAIVTSCKEDEIKENEKKSHIYAKQMYYSSAVVNKQDLEERQIEIKMSNSTQKLINEQKNNTLQIEKLSTLIEYLLSSNYPTDPPIIIPPEPCFNHFNCISVQNLTNVVGIVFQDDIEITSITLNDESENIIDNDFLKNKSKKQNIFIFGDEFSPNITKMYSTVSIDGTENIRLETPIVFE